MLCPHSTSSVGIKNVHLCTLASKFSSLTDSTQGFWLVTYFPSYLWTILYMNKLSILLGCQCCEKLSQIIHKNLTKTSKISHYTNSYQIPNLISKQIFQIKTLKYIFQFIIQWILLLMVSRDGPSNLQMSNFDLNMLSAVRIKQICILFEDLMHISMISLVPIWSLHQGIRTGRFVHISTFFKRSFTFPCLSKDKGSLLSETIFISGRFTKYKRLFQELLQ